MVKTDARVRYTRKVIKEILLRLLREKSIKEITVKEICDLAEINRATFYTHYKDAYDLLEQIENELLEDFTSAVTITSDGYRNQVKNLFHVIGKNVDLCRLLFSENGDKMFLRRLIDSSREASLEDLARQYPQAARIQLEYLYEFLTSGTSAVIAQWVNSGFKDPPLVLDEVVNKTVTVWLQTLENHP